MLDTQLDCRFLPLEEGKANLAAGRYDSVWSETRRLKIRGSINKAPIVYRALGDHMAGCSILCDVDHLELLARSWLTMKAFPQGCGFKGFRSFYTWYSNCRSFYDVVSGRRATLAAVARLEDDWAELIAHLSGHRGTPALFNTYQILPITTLARECRLRGISLGDLSAMRVLEFATALRPGVKASVRDGCTLVDSFRGSNHVPAALLPDAPIGSIPALTPPSIRRVPEVHPDFDTLLENYLDDRVNGRETVQFGSEPLPIETGGVGPRRAKNIRVAIRWLWHGAVALGVARHDQTLDLNVLTRPAIIHDVVRACAEGRLGPVCDGETRCAMVRTAIDFLDKQAPGFADSIDARFFQDKALKSSYAGESPDERKKREACLRFIRTPSFQRQFFSMPHLFLEKARPLIRSFHKLGPIDGTTISKDHHHALELAMMAALTAIITSFPGRLDTLAKLKLGGTRPDILFPGDSDGPQAVMLDIPGYIVKNGYYAGGIPLPSSQKIDRRAILEWYRDEAHHLVLKYKPTYEALRKPERLFCGLHIETLRRLWQRYSVEAGLDITAHMTRHLVASLLYARGVPIEAIAELLGDSVATTQKAYTFVDRVKLIQDAMEAQAKIYKELGL